jgi:hypothetical protein
MLSIPAFNSGALSGFLSASPAIPTLPMALLPFGFVADGIGGTAISAIGSQIFNVLNNLAVGLI